MSDWLPEHQRHLLYTLAHVDSVLDQLADVLHDFLEARPLEYENRRVSGREDVLIKAIAPIPESVPRLASDALNQLRSALEHALFAEVVQLTGRELTQEEAQAIEMPVARDPKALADWFKHRRRRTLPELQESGVLGRRVVALQPHEAADEQSHPLKVLAEYTNHSKHRMPAIAAVRLGTIIPDYVVPGLVIVGEYEDDCPLNVGDVLASVPAGVPVPMSIWPKFGIRRPHTGEWMVLMQELGQLEAWVRTEALPLIIVGTTEVDPIPTHLDLSRGYATYGEARAEAKGIPAVERHKLRIKGQGLRDDLPGVFAQKLPEVSRETVEAFVAGLSDDAAIELINRYMRVRENRGEPNAIAYLRRLVSAEDQ
ncbi:hypothetical protein [Arthrobacter sp. MAHUQ-56]